MALKGIKKIENNKSKSRREFIKNTAYACTGFPFISRGFLNAEQHGKNMNINDICNKGENANIIGAYGKWAASLITNPPKLSFRKKQWNHIDTWKKKAFSKAKELVAAPDIKKDSNVTVHKKYTYDGLEIEEISWQLSNGNGPTQAIVLKPEGMKEKLPAILALHDHGGNKYFGKRKITRVSDILHPIIEEHQKNYYEDRAWANEIAKRGYVVLIHDVFAFGSRRVLLDDVSGITWGGASSNLVIDGNPEEEQNIAKYNEWASNHEHVMSKSLFTAGTTWPGVVLAEDQAALSILANRTDVNVERIGCAGLSGGGLRTNYLAGLDERIKCAVSVGFMSTWNDFLLNKSFTHTWMMYAPLLPQYLEFPEILGLRVPLPTMVQSNNQDDLYTLPEMQKADEILSEVYKKAGAAENYSGKFYEGHHKFDAQMQADAFDWFDKWLKI